MNCPCKGYPPIHHVEDHQRSLFRWYLKLVKGGWGPIEGVKRAMELWAFYKFGIR